MAADQDDVVVEELSEEECIRLLSEGHLGRLAVVHDDQPLIFPVNYVFEAGAVVFRSNAGTKLEASQLNRVAFEIDGRSGGDWWSVVVAGTGQDITATLDSHSAEMRALAVEPSIKAGRDHWVEITAAHITGRRLRSG